jgi:PKD repeat protein
VIAAAICTLAIVLLPAVAQAEYGEVQRIGGKTAGTNNGQLTSERTRLLGADPTENSVYVLDEPQKFSQTEEPEINPVTKECEKNEITGKCVMVGVGPLTRHFRIQKFSATKGYGFAAAVHFDEIAPEPQFYSGATFAAGVEGIAVDPELKRLYVLTADNRQKGLSVDARSVKEAGGQGLLAASTLYAFSTQGKEEGSKGVLVPAVGSDPVIAGPGVLEPQSTTAGKALLEPAGITVDPKTHDVIVLGHVDEGGQATDDIASAGDHYALQRIKSDGTLGARYVDKTDFFKTASKTAPDSPVVVPAAGTSERVYVNYQGIAEVPYDFGTTAPHTLSPELMPPFPEGTAQGPLASQSSLVSTSTRAAPGGVLSAAPSPDGNVYGWAEVRTEELGGGTQGDRRDGVLKLSGSDGSDLGWTGGQTPLLEEGVEIPCAAQPALLGAPELPLRIAAGSGGAVFVFNPEFLKRKEWEGTEEPWTKEGEEEQEVQNEGPIEPSPKPFYPAIIEFGENGKGCPHVKTPSLEARAGGKPLTEAQSVPIGSPVTFSSEFAQGDALGETEWEFINVENEAIVEKQKSSDKWTKTTVTHKFEHEGQFKVKETIHTDNLATPTITKEGSEKVHVSEAVLGQPIILGPATALVNQTVTFTDPNPSGVAKYKWSFGDGKAEETTKPEAKHAYGAAGSYQVKLVVANAKGKESPAGVKNITITEKEEPKPPPPPQPPPPPSGETPSGPGPSGPAPGGGGGSGGVLPYRVSLAGTTLAVSPAGTLGLKVDCLGQSSCAGTVTLKTLSAVSARVAKKRKAVLTLASGSFSVAGGHVKTVTLRLTAKARALLARSHVLRVGATILGRDSAGATHTTQTTVTLRAAKSARGHR